MHFPTSRLTKKLRKSSRNSLCLTTPHLPHPHPHPRSSLDASARSGQAAGRGRLEAASWVPSPHPSSWERKCAGAPRRWRPLLAESGSGLLRRGFADCLSRAWRTMPSAECSLGRPGQEKTRRGKSDGKKPSHSHPPSSNENSFFSLPSPFSFQSEGGGKGPERGDRWGEGMDGDRGWMGIGDGWGCKQRGDNPSGQGPGDRGPCLDPIPISHSSPSAPGPQGETPLNVKRRDSGWGG